MDRMTNSGTREIKTNFTIREAAIRLSEYEDMGLMPEKILEMDEMYQELSKEVMGYRKIGTVEECREAVEKQRVRKPVKDEYNHECCPSCGWIVFKDEYGGRCLPHCENCGQAIDWSDGEESLPHAYNVERVIERLERELSSCVDYHRKYGNCGNQICAYKKALKIVKSGGFEE